MTGPNGDEAQRVVLVAGATGNVGRHVVSELLGAGAAVRALTRDPASAGLPQGADAVRGDLGSPDSLHGALEGVDAVFFLWPFLTAEAAPALLATVKRHARRVVYLSSLGVREDRDRQADPINQFHADMERHVERSGLEWTFLRPSGFAVNTLGWAEQVRAPEGVVRQPYRGASRSLIHERDIAAVAARALTGAGHERAKYVLTGPEALTQAEQVRIIGEAIGRPLRFEEVPPEAARQRMLAEGWPDAVVNGMLDAWAGFAVEPEAVTSTVEELTGAPARTFREWAADHAADFR